MALVSSVELQGLYSWLTNLVIFLRLITILANGGDLKENGS